MIRTQKSFVILVISGICARNLTDASPLAGPLGVWESCLHFLFDVVVHSFRKNYDMGTLDNDARSAVGVFTRLLQLLKFVVADLRLTDQDAAAETLDQITADRPEPPSG